jgi:hypothetical protein
MGEYDASAVNMWHNGSARGRIVLVARPKKHRLRYRWIRTWFVLDDPSRRGIFGVCMAGDRGLMWFLAAILE